MTTAPYPADTGARRQWIEARRGARNAADARKPHACFVERECSSNGKVVSVATILLTNRECPWRCLMCDLWKNTLAETVPPGAIAEQIDAALRNCKGQVSDAAVSLLGTDPWHVKLYNSGSFFDRAAIPAAEHADIARRVSGFERVIVECHPKLVSDGVVAFRDLVGTELEVAMGLETANEEVLARLNKGMTLEDFARAARFLTQHGIAVRAFVLLRPPFMSEEDGILWARKSIEFAFDCGVEVVSVIPTRAGNGALDALRARGEFCPPRLASLEEVIDYGVGLKRGRVFADLWELEQFSKCPNCINARKQRLEAMNLSQQPLPGVSCSECEG